MSSFFSPSGNYEVWEEKPIGYFTSEEWDELHPPELAEAPEQASLEEVKLAKRQEINAERDRLEQGGFSFKGNVFDSDQVSYTRLLGASQTAQTSVASGLPYGVEWTLQDNTICEMSAQDMIDIIPAFAVYSNTLHEKANLLKNQVADAISIEEVEIIFWD